MTTLRRSASWLFGIIRTPFAMAAILSVSTAIAQDTAAQPPTPAAPDAAAQQAVTPQPPGEQPAAEEQPAADEQPAAGDEPLLKFNFRSQKWPAVLDWLAGEAGLSLVMDEAPPGVFNYTDVKAYTPTEAIDLLNGWLLTKGYTLVRRERLLMCLNLKAGLPDNAIPRITIEDLATRGRFEFVSVLIPLQTRPAETVLSEIQPLLGTYGKAEVLTATQQLLVADAAATVRTIQQVVEKVPIPVNPPGPAPPPPKPELVVYPIEHANPKQAGEVLQTIIDGTLVVDEAASQISVNAAPDEQAKAKIIIQQLESNQGADKQPLLKMYPARPSDATEMLATLQLIAPNAQFRYDGASRKLVAWAPQAEQLRIATSLQELAAQQPAGGPTQLEVYRLNKIAPDTAQTLITTLLPDARVTLDSRTTSLVAIGTLADHQAIRNLLEQLESQIASSKPAELQFYPLEKASGAKAVALLSAMLPAATISFDEEAKRLSVVAEPPDHEVVKTTLARLEATAPVHEKRVLKIYDVTSHQRARFTAALAGLTAENPGVQVLADAQPGEVTVWAKPSEHEIVSEVLSQLERSVPADQQPTLIVYPIRSVDPGSVATVLTELFPDAKITTDTAAPRLLIHAPPAMQATIKSAIEQLDSDLPGDTEIKLMVYPVHGVDAASALQLLQTEVPKATVIHDTVAQTFIVRASLERQQQVADLLDALQTAATPLQKRTAVVYPTSQSKSNIEQSFFETAFPNATFVIDPSTQAMTALATAADHQGIAQAVEAMTKTGERTAELKEYRIEPAHVSGVSQMLAEAVPNAQTVFSGNRLLAWALPAEHLTIERITKGVQKPAVSRRIETFALNKVELANAQTVLAQAAADVVFLTSSDRKSLIALVDSEQKQKIETTLAELAKSPAAVAERVLAVYDIRGADPAAVQTVLQPLIDANVTVTADPTGRRLYVRAFPEQQQVVKTTIEQITADLTPDGKLETKTYLVGAPNADEAQEVLMALYPDATIVIDADRKLIVATATPEQHVMIEQISKQIAGAGQLENAPYAVVYTLNNVPATQAEDLLDNLFTRYDAVRVSVNERTGRLVAVAREDQHTIIASLIEQFDGDAASEIQRELAVYRVHPLDGLTVKTALEPLVSEDVVISADRRAEDILVSAPPAEQKQIAELVRQITTSRAGGEGAETRTYRMNVGDADAAQSALRALFPDATLVTDRFDKVLVATASPEQHKTIETVVRQMNGQDLSTDRPAPRAYRLNQADGNTVVEVLENLFTRSDEVRLSLDERNQTVVAIATPDQHQMIQQTLADLDPAEGAAAYTLQVYPVNDLDEEQVRQVIEDMLVERYPGSRVHHETATGNLLVTTNQAGHQLVEQTITRFGRPEPREMEVFQLSFLEPATAETAIDSMISSQYPSEINQPIVHADEDTQQLWVQASKQQLVQMRALLTRMGEKGLDTSRREPANPNLRIIPIGNDVEATIRQIQDLWPRLRRNPIKVTRPRETSLNPTGIKPKNEAESSQKPARVQEPQGADRRLPSGSQPLAADERLRNPAAPFSEHSSRAGIPADRVQSVDASNAGRTYLTSLPDETQSGPSDSPDQQPGPPNQPPGADTSSTATEFPAITIVPGDGRLTIASDDTEALDQLESLLRAIHSRAGSGRNQDFGVYQLRNAGAVDVSATLQQIFDDSDGLMSFGDVVMVPDERLNALIVYASRADRGRVEQLLEVLDSEKLEDTRRAFQTEVVPLQYASATDVEDVIQGVYTAERTAGGARSNIAIPKGVPSNVASVLRQINAAASSPLLTVEVQTETNSLIIKAPQTLLDEVRDLVLRLDESAHTTRARGITLLPLKKANSSRVMKILNDVLD
ncbi:MAG: secretin N-terminal domain-containing protein [Fuerstiella sp.]